MLDRTMLYSILYALAASGGREVALFGRSASAAREAFMRSVPADAFPELWFELPLAGEPWFDFHALTAREDLSPDMSFDPQTTGGFPEAFAWFARQDASVRQLALSWDTGSGTSSAPAVQLLVGAPKTRVTCDFLAAVGRPDAAPAYRAFLERLPKGWFACYAGVFPSRPGHNLRVECIPETHLQKAYAQDAALLREHLRSVGLVDFGETLVPRCQTMADTPFALEFQFDVLPDGTAGPTFGASLRFSAPGNEEEAWQAFDPEGAGGELMRHVESWGLADERWRLLSQTAFANRVTFGSESITLWCFPAFVKLRWRDGEPVDAKAYLMAGAQ